MAPPPASAVDKDKKFEPRLKTWNDCDYIQVIKSAFKCTLLCSVPRPRATPASAASFIHIHILHSHSPPLRALPSKFNERYGIKIISSARPMAGKQDKQDTVHTHTQHIHRQHTHTENVTEQMGAGTKLRKKQRPKLKTKEMSKTPGKSDAVCTAHPGPIP